MIIKFVKIMVSSLVLAFIIIVGYFAFLSATIKSDIKYENLADIPYVNWYNVRSGLFGSILKIMNIKSFKSTDSNAYLTIIPPKEDDRPISGTYTLNYFGNGVKMEDSENIKLSKYSGVYRTRLMKADYLLFAQEHIQKDNKTGFLIITYPVNLIKDKTVSQFIQIVTGPSMFSPSFSPIYKFESFETCTENLEDPVYCKWFISKQNSVGEVIKKWGDTGFVPLDILRYPLVINTNEQ